MFIAGQVHAFKIVIISYSPFPKFGWVFMIVILVHMYNYKNVRNIQFTCTCISNKYFKYLELPYSKDTPRTHFKHNVYLFERGHVVILFLLLGNGVFAS